MIKHIKIIFFYGLVVAISSCSQVLQTVDLQINTVDNSAQEKFDVVETVLTIQKAKKLSDAPYDRKILRPGRGSNAQTVSENLVVQSKFPEIKENHPYKIGIGDTLTFSRLIENNRLSLDKKTQWPIDSKIFNYTLGVGDKLALTLLKEENTLSRNIIPNEQAEEQSAVLQSQNDVVLETKGRIGQDGSVLLLEVGRLEAKGKTLSDLQSEVRNILIRNGTSPRFQLGIIEFNSQKAYLTVNNTSNVIFLDDQKTSLKDILTSAKVGIMQTGVTNVRLQRNGEEYLMSLRKIFDQSAPEVVIFKGDHIFVEDTSREITTTTSTVGANGNVVFPTIGEIKALNKTLSELREEMKSFIEKIPGSQNIFQIEITVFASQTAIINIPGVYSGVVKITDKPLALDEVLTSNGLSLNRDSITRINLYREGRSYEFNLGDLLNPINKRIYLQPNDRVLTETLSYKDNKVFILGGIDPQIYKINPVNRETLADVLFTSGGVLSSSRAKRSEVYLLRGSNPVNAYRLDAQSPTRLIVAEAMELRPNDILYVAEQPIASFNRTLATIVPLRILLRDIQDENIP